MQANLQHGAPDDSPWTVSRPATFGGVTKAMNGSGSRRSRLLVRADMVFDKTFEDWKDWPQHCRLFFHQKGDFPMLPTRTRARSIHCPLTHSLADRDSALESPMDLEHYEGKGGGK